MTVMEIRFLILKITAPFNPTVSRGIRIRTVWGISVITAPIPITLLRRTVTKMEQAIPVMSKILALPAVTVTVTELLIQMIIVPRFQIPSKVIQMKISWEIPVIPAPLILKMIGIMMGSVELKITAPSLPMSFKRIAPGLGWGMPVIL